MPGATYPLGIDPKDSNIRIAPTFPSDHELEVAMDVFWYLCKACGLRKDSDKVIII